MLNRKQLLVPLLAIGTIGAMVPMASASPDGYRIISGDVDRLEIAKSTTTRREASPVAIIFHDAAGKERKRIPLISGDKIENGRYMRRMVSVLDNPGKSHVLVAAVTLDLTERNPYKIRASSRTHLSWYAADGSQLCEQNVRFDPRLISADGRRLVGTDIGFDPVAFERFHDVPNLKSLDALRADPTLMESRLVVIGERCEILYSAVSRKGGWDVMAFSPSGRWLVVEQQGSATTSSGSGWKYSLHLIDVEKGQVHVLEWDREMRPATVDDDGAMTAWRLVGPSKRTHKVKFYGGIEKDVPYQVFRKCIWPLGEKGFRDTRDEKEE
jgi:hypothetical protein